MESGKLIAMDAAMWISKKECALRLNVSQGAISHYCTKGLESVAGRPTDTLLNWNVVTEWVRLYVNPRRSGSYRFRMLKRQAAERAVEVK